MTRSLKYSEEYTTIIIIYFLPRGTELISRLTFGFLVNGSGGNGASSTSAKFAQVFCSL